MSIVALQNSKVTIILVYCIRNIIRNNSLEILWEKKNPYRFSLLETVILVLEIHSQIVHR